MRNCFAQRNQYTKADRAIDIAALQSEFDTAVAEAHQQTNRITALQSELDAIHRSKIWRFTRPARLFGNVLKRIF